MHIKISIIYTQINAYDALELRVYSTADAHRIMLQRATVIDNRKSVGVIFVGRICVYEKLAQFMVKLPHPLIFLWRRRGIVTEVRRSATVESIAWPQDYGTPLLFFIIYSCERYVQTGFTVMQCVIKSF